MLEYADHIAALQATHPELAAAFAHSDALENVLGWMKERNLPAGTVDLVGQDEFSYDFLIRLDDIDRWLVFGVN